MYTHIYRYSHPEVDSIWNLQRYSHFSEYVLDFHRISIFYLLQVCTCLIFSLVESCRRGSRSCLLAAGAPRSTSSGLSFLEKRGARSVSRTSKEAILQGFIKLVTFHWPVGYGSIPINTIFSGMNIHLPAILMFTRGTRFWHTASWFYNPFDQSALW
jgi:hypothetical protein